MKTIAHVSAVKKVLERQINDYFDSLTEEEQAEVSALGIPKEVSEGLCRKAFAERAHTAGVTESTVRAACTRELGINTEEFFDQVRDSIAGGTRLRETARKSPRNDYSDRVIDSLF